MFIFTVFNYEARCGASLFVLALNVVFAGIPAKVLCQVNIAYLHIEFVQLNDKAFSVDSSFCSFPALFRALLQPNKG